MTAFLRAEAASDYLRLTLFAYDNGLIGQTHYEARLSALGALAGYQGGAALYAVELLGDTVHDSDDWALGDDVGDLALVLPTTV